MKLHQFVLSALVGMLIFALSPAVAYTESDDVSAVQTSGKSKKKNKKNKKSKKKDAETEAVEEQAAEEEETAAKKDKNAPSAVAAALAKFKVFNGRPNLKADYYIYLYSASWCGYCQQCMPVAVDQYKKIRGNRKVELILICGDNSMEEGKNYLKSKKLKSPAIMFSELEATQFRGLPGCGLPGFPAITIVDKDGAQITNVVGASKVNEVLENWREYTIANKS